MTTATITTDIHIGEWKIPSNGQNMIMNDYARRNKISVEFVIPEPINLTSFPSAIVTSVPSSSSSTKFVIEPEPAGPVGPVEPVGPAGPVGPVGPAGPVEP